MTFLKVLRDCHVLCKVGNSIAYWRLDQRTPYPVQNPTLLGTYQVALCPLHSLLHSRGEALENPYKL